MCVYIHSAQMYITSIPIFILCIASVLFDPLTGLLPPGLDEID